MATNYYGTLLSKRNRAITQLRDVYSTAALMGWTHQELLNRIVHIKETVLKGTPTRAQAYFDGYKQALDDALYMTSLMFGGYYKGKFYSTHSDRPDYYAENDIMPSEWSNDGAVTERGHYWTTTKDPKPFFISKGSKP